jgi:hypothetical protein
MPAGGICPQCRADVSPMAKFCAKCGVEITERQTDEVIANAKGVGLLICWIVIFIAMAGGLFIYFAKVHRQIVRNQTFEQSSANDSVAEAQREAIAHKNDAWWDPNDLDGFKQAFYGKEYRVEPGTWTSIDVTTPMSSEHFKYIVVFEGLDRFRARPDGDHEREFVYPDPRGLQPYQMSGECWTLLVQPLDNFVHQVRVKYLRKPRYQ